jgi:hypothetical protein
VRLQLHALAYNLANLLRTLALPQEVEHWSLTTLREKLVKIGARIVRHGWLCHGRCSPRSCAGSSGSDQSQRRHERRAPTMDSKPAGEVRPSSTENRSNVT